MLLRTIYEGIRMGSSDLSIKPKKDYTIGFEFEVAIPDDAVQEFEYEDYEDFGSNNQDFDYAAFAKEWFENNILHKDELSDLVKDHDIEPKFGFVSSSDEDIEDMQREFDDNLIEKYGEDIVDEMQELLLDIKEDPDIELDDDMIYAILSAYNTHKGFEDDPEKIERLVKKVKGQSDPVSVLLTPIKVLTSTFLFDESGLENNDAKIYTDKSKNNTITLDEISTADDFFEYFDIDEFDLQNILEEIVDYQLTLEDVQAELDNNDTETDAIRTVRNSIASALGTKVGKYSSTSEWSVDEDGTIGVDAEIRSPVLSIKQGIKDMNTVFDAIRDSAMYTTPATGLHINIGTWNATEYNNIDWLKFLIIVDPSRILNQFGRSGNNFAPDKMDKIVDALKKEDLQSYSALIKDINQSAIDISEKYSAVNLSKLQKHGYIELRAPGNSDYEKRGDEVTALIRKTIRALELASDPKAFKNQYLKRLYTVSNTINTKTNNKPTNIYDFFAQYTGMTVAPNRPFDALIDIVDRIVHMRQDANDQTIEKMDKALTMPLIQDLINMIKSYMASNTIEYSEIIDMEHKLSQLPEKSKTVIMLKKLTKIVSSQTAPQTVS